MANNNGPGLTTPSNSQLRFHAETSGGQTAQGIPRPPWKAAVSNAETEAIGSFHLSPGDQWYVLGGMLMPIQPNPGNLATEAQLRQPPDFSNSTILTRGLPLVKTQGNSKTRQHTSQHLPATPREILGYPWTPVWHSTFRGVPTAFSQNASRLLLVSSSADRRVASAQRKGNPHPRRDNKPCRFFRRSLTRRGHRTRYFGPNLRIKIAHHNVRASVPRGWLVGLALASHLQIVHRSDSSPQCQSGKHLSILRPSAWLLSVPGWTRDVMA